MVLEPLPLLLFLSNGSTFATGFLDAAASSAEAGRAEAVCDADEVGVDDECCPRCSWGMKLGAKGDGVGSAGELMAAGGGMMLLVADAG